MTSRKNNREFKTEIFMKPFLALTFLVLCGVKSLSSQCSEDIIKLRIDFKSGDFTLDDSTEMCFDQLITNFRTIYPDIGKRIYITYYAPNNLTEVGGNIKLIQDYLSSNHIEEISYNFNFIFDTRIMDSNTDYVWIGIVLNESP